MSIMIKKKAQKISVSGGVKAIILGLLVSVFAGSTSAHALSTLNPKWISDQFKPAEAQKMLGIFDSRLSEINKQEEKSSNTLKSEIDGVVSPYLMRANAILEKDPALKIEHSGYQQAIKKILSSNQSSAQKNKQLIELANKQRPVFEKWIADAQINIAELSSKLEGMVKKYALMQGKRYEFSNDGFMSFRWRFISPQKARQDHQTQIVLEAPFAFKDTDHNGNGSEDVDLIAGRFTSFAAGVFLAGHTNRAGLGQFLEIPQGGYRLGRLVAALPQTEVSMTAFSDILGATGASAKTSVDVFSNNRIICRETFDHGTVLAPILWYSSISSTDTYDISCDFDAPAAGREIVVHFASETSVWAVTLGGSNSYVKATPRDLKVIFSN